MQTSINEKISDTAMVLAAGMGMRMRPLSLTRPKPLLEVGGKAMLDHAIDRLKEVGARRVVVNAFWLAEQIEAHSAKRGDIKIAVSQETELLDTGGGVKNALALLDVGDRPFFVLNSDLPWFDAPSPALPSLRRMAEAWDPERMDALLLVMPIGKALGFSGKGDFMQEKDGRLWRKDAPFPRSHVFVSAQIVKPELFRAEKYGKVFSSNAIWNDLEAAGRLYGVSHEGSCYHVGTPEDLVKANSSLESGRGWKYP